MTYEDLLQHCQQLSSLEKLRLAEALIQEARQALSQSPGSPGSMARTAPVFQTMDEAIDYVIKRLSKMKPTKRKTLENAVITMFQAQGGISGQECELIVLELEKRGYVSISASNRVTYRG
ncbi:MAG: hypothetical protein VKK80_04320 [Prochlorothrix sp.]|nr:hypothetical protein [Prochlorothrix sp.]